MKDAETQLEHFALELFNWHLANNPKIHDLCLHAQEMAIAAAQDVDQPMKLPWIRITPETMPPLNLNVLFFECDDEDGGWYKGRRAIRQGVEYIYDANGSYGYEPTHYMLIEGPGDDN